jgi:hypothetical protein
MCDVYEIGVQYTLSLYTNVAGKGRQVVLIL